MKKFLKVTALVLASASAISAGYAKASDDNGALPHVDANHQFPPTSTHTVRKTFELHIPKNSKQISEIIIQVPEVVNWSYKAKDIVVIDGKGKKVKHNVAIKDRNIILSFAEHIAPNTELEIDINNVKRVRLGNGPVYRLFAKFVGSDVLMDMGVARFRLK
jgi:hypothetical protein